MPSELNLEVGNRPVFRRLNAGDVPGEARHGCRASHDSRQGWRVVACPRNRIGERAVRAIGEDPAGGAKRFGYFSAIGKVTRRKGGAILSAYTSTGYIPNPNP